MKRLISRKESLQGVFSPNEKLHYQPLSRPDEIRLVKIFPGSAMSTVKCELQSAILEPETPKYIALSYCWGNATHKTWVNCNGQRLALTKDLLNAIRRLRRKNETVVLWIDQICINQEDVEERSSQVRLMRKIYRSAANVLIWLGDEADKSNMAIELIARLSAHPDKDIHSWTAKEWRALGALLSRPWFTRMWILQELGVASSATVVCGNQSISWQYVSDTINYMQNTGSWLVVFGSSGYTSSILAYGRLASLQSIRNEISENGTVCSLNALCTSMYFDATDPRDKVYALTGLCVCNGHFIRPDYSKDLLDVYRETALAFLFPQDAIVNADSSLKFHEHPTMQCLNAAERTENPYALPSWVPDWKARTYSSFWERSSENGYNAAGTSKTKIALTDDPNKISLAAKIGDVVHLVSSIAPAPGYTAPPSDKSPPEVWERFLFHRVPQSCWINETSFMAANCQRYEDSASRDAAFRSTLIGNTANYCATSTSGQTVETNPDHAFYYWHFRQFLLKLCPNGVVNGAGILQLCLNLAQHMEAHQVFEGAYMAVSQGRRFFTTLGGYMGIGPPGMRPGDSICVFLGGNVPWVVRQEGYEYMLVGECYVHGIMDGEIMQTEHLPIQEIIFK